MKIESLEISNFKSLKAVKIEPKDSDVVVIAGENGSGKSSIFEAINCAIRQAGDQGYERPHGNEVLTKGAKAGHIIVRFSQTKAEETISGHAGPIVLHLKFDSTTTEYAIGPDSNYGPFQKILEQRAQRERQLLLSDEETPSDDVPGMFIHRNPYRLENPDPISNPNVEAIKPENERSRRAMRSDKPDSKSNIITSYLLSEDRKLNSDFTKRYEKGEFKTEKDGLPFIDKRRTRILVDFNELLSPKKYVGIEESTTGLPAKFLVSVPNVGDVEFKDLSSGEREALFLFADLRRRKTKDCIIAIDEPELHLHHNLQRKLVERLGALGQRNQIWLTTHSVPIVRAASDVKKGVIFHLESYQDGVGNQASLVTGRSSLRKLYDSIADDIAALLVGEKLIFTEGGDLDKPDARNDADIYEAMFPQSKVGFAPGGNADAVKATVRIAYQWLGLKLPNKIYTLRDRDGRSKEALKQLEERDPRLRHTSRRNVESYLVEPRAVWEVLQEVGIPDGLKEEVKSFEDFEKLMGENIPKLADRDKDPDIDYKASLEAVITLVTTMKPQEFKVRVAGKLAQLTLVDPKLIEIIHGIEQAK